MRKVSTILSCLPFLFIWLPFLWGLSKLTFCVPWYFSQLTVIFCSLFVSKVLKYQLCQPDRRFDVYSILTMHVHSPEKVPGVVEAVYHELIPVSLHVSRAKRSIVRYSWVVLAPSPHSANATFWSIFERTTCKCWFGELLNPTTTCYMQRRLGLFLFSKAHFYICEETPSKPSRDGHFIVLEYVVACYAKHESNIILILTSVATASPSQLRPHQYFFCQIPFDHLQVIKVAKKHRKKISTYL